jgi:hypothetical protein
VPAAGRLRIAVANIAPDSRSEQRRPQARAGGYPRPLGAEGDAALGCWLESLLS